MSGALIALCSLSYQDVFLICFSLVSPASFENVRAKVSRACAGITEGCKIISVDQFQDMRGSSKTFQLAVQLSWDTSLFWLPWCSCTYFSTIKMSGVVSFQQCSPAPRGFGQKSN